MESQKSIDTKVASMIWSIRTAYYLEQADLTWNSNDPSLAS